MKKQAKEVKTVQLNDKYFGTMKTLNKTIFPKFVDSEFSESQYQLIKEYGYPFSFLAYIEETPSDQKTQEKKDGKKFVGEILCYLDDDTGGSHINVMFLEGYRRRGISKKLIQKCREAILSFEPKVIRVFCLVELDNKVALEMYKKAGFKCIKKVGWKGERTLMELEGIEKLRNV